MKISAKFALAACLSVFLNGCYQSQRQMPPPVLPDETQAQGKVINGPFGEQLPEPERQSPFDQPQAEEVGGNPLQSEISGSISSPNLQVIDGRISAYTAKVARWNELESKSGTPDLSADQAARLGGCYQEIQRILSGYNTLRSAVERGDRGDVAENSVYSGKMQELQQGDIAFLESACGPLLSGSPTTPQAGGQQVEAPAALPQEAEMADLAGKKDYKAMEQAWLQIPEMQQEQLSLKTKMLYAEALVFLQKEEKAAELYRRIIDRMTTSAEQSTDPIVLRKTLADLYVATGNYVEAENQYVKISKDYLELGNTDNWAKVHLAVLGGNRKDSLELADYSGLLRNYLGYIPAQDGYKVVWEAEKFLQAHPGSPVAANVERIKTQATGAADKWFNGFLAEINNLAAEKRFQDAIAKLKGQRTDIINDQQLDLLNAKNDELVLADAVDQETSKMAKLQELEQRWNNGLMLEKSGRYEEAISVFNGMNETDYAVKADAKIKEISALAAKDDRRKAADLFIRFTKTTDVESKKKLLIESRRLLKDILVKYPRVDITDKVLGNIQRVEQEMNAIDPQLISAVDSQGAAPTPQETAPEPPTASPEDAFPPKTPPIVESPLPQ